jgi:hypothetical protein
MEHKKMTQREAKRGEIRSTSFTKEYNISLSGFVKNKRGNAIANANISINGIAYRKTDSSGYFDFSRAIALREDSINIAISAIGYTTKYIKLPANNCASINVIIDDMELIRPEKQYDLLPMLEGRVGGISIKKRSVVGRWISSLKSGLTRI